MVGVAVLSLRPRQQRDPNGRFYFNLCRPALGLALCSHGTCLYRAAGCGADDSHRIGFIDRDVCRYPYIYKDTHDPDDPDCSFGFRNFLR
jgi:hypothetical protein